MEQKLTVTIDGPGVRQGKIALRDLQRIIHPLEQAVQALLPRQPRTSSRASASSRQPVRFLLSRIDSGSAVAEGSLVVEATIAESMFNDDPLDRLINGLTSQDAELSTRAKRYIERLQRNLPIGVESIDIAIPGLPGKARLEPLSRVEARLPSTDERTVTGRLMEINFRAKRALLEIPRVMGRRSTQQIALQFPDELASDMQRLARQLVVVDGRAALADNGAILKLELDSIALYIDDRTGLWPAKKFRWPTPEERLTNVDMEEFLRSSKDLYEDEP